MFSNKVSTFLSVIFTTLLIPSKSVENDKLLFGNAGVLDIETNGLSASTKCQEQLEESLQSGIWIQMLDASSKSIDGLAVGNLYALGHFDECYNIDASMHSQNDRIYGQYCLGSVQLDALGNADYLLTQQNQSNIQFQKTQILGSKSQSSSAFHIAVCLPSGCTADDATNLTSNIVTFSEQYCYSKETAPKLSWGGILTITILGIFLGLVLISTIFDLYLFYQKKNSPHQLLVAFSAFSNAQQLIKPSSNPDQLLCLNGIKAISMMWVVLGHKYSTALSYPLHNFLDIMTWKDNIFNMIMIGATVSVDTFFMVAGLVTVYTFLKAIDKGIKLNIPLYYLHRYLRLTPALAILMLIYATLLNSISNGPLWNIVTSASVEPCRTNWWTNLIYIQNYYMLKENEQMCIGQSWYLAVDMQLFLLSPFLLIPLSKWPKPTLAAMTGLVLFGCAVDFTIGYMLEIPAFYGMVSRRDFMTQYYASTHTRYGPYVIGMIFGYFIYRHKTGHAKITLRTSQTILLWMASLSMLLACLFAGHTTLILNTDYDKLASSFYLALNRPAWALALGGVIIACIADCGGFINAFLSHPIFQFLTKLSYSMYLIHGEVIVVMYSSARLPMEFSNLRIMTSFWGDFMLTMAISFVFCLTFESPVIIIEKVIFGRGTEKVSAIDKKKPIV